MELKDLMGSPGVITLIGPDGTPIQVTHDQLAKMDNPTLLGLRKSNPDPNAQDLLSGYEHRAAARGAGQENPLMAVSYGAAVPMYQMAKALPRSMTGLQSRTGPSMHQLNQGLIGAGEGIVQGVRNWMK